MEGWSLPGAPYDTAGVTPRRLFAHTSGLPFVIESTPSSPARFRSGEVDEEAFTLVQEPGSGSIYSNAGYALLALLIEEAAGDEFATVVDLARFVAAAYDGDPVAGRGVLTPAQLREVHRPRVATAGLPHRLMTDAAAYGHCVEEFEDAELVLNAGEEEGWIGRFATVPATGQGMVVLTNGRNGYPLLVEELRAWSQANQLGRPTLVSVYRGLRTSAWVAIAGLTAGSVGLAVAIASRPRPAGPLASTRHRSRWGRRLTALGTSVLLVAVWWTVLVRALGAVLPDLSRWLGLTVTAAGALLALRALAPDLTAPASTGTARAARPHPGKTRLRGAVRRDRPRRTAQR